MILLLFIGTLAISLLATARVKTNYLRYSRVIASSGFSGAEVAMKILNSAGINNVRSCRRRGYLPTTMTRSTSDWSYRKTIIPDAQWRPWE